MIETLRVTESTTRDELIMHIDNLEEEVQQLETTIQDQKSEINALAITPGQLNRLAEAADFAAAHNVIHNTPHAKFQYIQGN